MRGAPWAAMYYVHPERRFWTFGCRRASDGGQPGVGVHNPRQAHESVGRLDRHVSRNTGDARTPGVGLRIEGYRGAMRAGEKVTVFIQPKGPGYPGRVGRSSRHGRFPVTVRGGVSIDFRAEDEGVTWCRGWEGEAVSALQAVAALR